MFKVLLALAAIGVTAKVVTDSMKKGAFKIDIFAYWGAKSAIIIIKDGDKNVFHKQVSLNDESVFGQSYNGFVFRVTPDKKRGIYLVEIYEKDKMIGGNMIDFTNQKVINLV